VLLRPLLIADVIPVAARKDIRCGGKGGEVPPPYVESGSATVRPPHLSLCNWTTRPATKRSGPVVHARLTRAEVEDELCLWRNAMLQPGTRCC